MLKYNVNILLLCAVPNCAITHCVIDVNVQSNTV
jgi:hypothetical protein